MSTRVDLSGLTPAEVDAVFGRVAAGADPAEVATHVAELAHQRATSRPAARPGTPGDLAPYATVYGAYA